MWGYLWPLSDKSDSVIKLNKQAPAPDKKKKKKGTKGKKIPPNGFLVGRHAECDLLIDDAVISNRHCVIFKVSTICVFLKTEVLTYVVNSRKSVGTSL